MVRAAVDSRTAPGAFVRRVIADASFRWSESGAEHCFRLGALTLRLRTCGAALDPVILPVLRHAQTAEPTAKNDGIITVYAVSHEDDGFPAPPAEWPFEAGEADAVARTVWDNEAGVAVVSDESRGIWHLHDLSAGTGVYWVGAAARLPAWEYGSPLRHHIHWGALTTGQAMLHSAVVGENGVGVMLAGPGGSGKSTLTAAAISSGMQTTGDDIVLVSRSGADWRSHSLFDTMKLTGMAETLFSGLAAQAVNQDRRPGEKALIPISTTIRDALVPQIAVKALVSCKLTGEDASVIRPASRFEMIRALSPSTSKILRTGHSEIFQQVASLSRSLPCHEFLIGNDPMEATTVLRGFVRELRA